MKTVDVLMVRIYVTESSHLLKQITEYLKKELKVRGVSVFRAIDGFSATKDHTASFVELSLNLPLTLEFFDDDRDKVEQGLNYLTTIVKPEHIVVWDAKANI